MKKLLTLALALMLILSLAACGGGNDEPAPVDTPDPGASQQEPSDTPDDSTPTDNTGILPDNDFTKLVPQPQSGQFIEIDTLLSMDRMEIYIMEWTLEDAKAYVQLCKDTGFTDREFDTEGEHSYTWYAYDAEARMVEVKWSDNEDCYIKVQRY